MQHALLVVLYLRWQSMRYKQHAVQAACGTSSMDSGWHSFVHSPYRSLLNAAVSTWLRNPALSHQCSRVERGERMQHLRHCPHMQGSDCTSYSTCTCQTRCNCCCRCHSHTGVYLSAPHSAQSAALSSTYHLALLQACKGYWCVPCASLLSRHLVQPWRLKCCAWTRKSRLEDQPTGCL